MDIYTEFEEKEFRRLFGGSIGLTRNKGERLKRILIANSGGLSLYDYYFSTIKINDISRRCSLSTDTVSDWRETRPIVFADIKQGSITAFATKALEGVCDGRA
ncbi:MAG: hypothetical protein J7L21_01910 [Sulfurimonas sp.]|nr:hypothetical protein [Sulfurimonas sp.]